MTVRKLTAAETDSALALAIRVFECFEAPDYSPEGTENFLKTLRDPTFGASILCYGAFEQHTLVGMLATRSEGRHISLFFVEEAFQRRGVGRALFEAALADATGDAITVNSSPFAVKVYRRLGFKATKPEQTTDGIRYTPMRYPLTEKT